MRFPGKWPQKGQSYSTADIAHERYQTMDFLRNRGTAKLPDPPRDVIAQSASRGVLLTWGLPAVYFDIVGWRIYKSDENTLYHELRDRGTRQMYVEASSGASPSQNNFFVSSINALGKESNKVQVQQKATAESGAPSVPSTPGGYTSGSGSDRSNGYGRFLTY